MIETAQRLHTIEEYYFSKKLREVRALVTQGKPIINMGIGSPDLKPPKEVVQAIREALTDQGAHQYQSYQGLPELRNSMADFYQRQFEVTLDPASEILPLMGSKEGIMHISMAFLNKGDEVLIPDPGYPTYEAVTRLVGGVPRKYRLSEENGWFPKLEQLRAQDLSKVKIMWIGYPHMPTGATARREEFKALIAFAREHHILVVNDNPYSFVLNPNPVSLLQINGAKDVAMELNSLSKTFNMAGWRVGMVIGSAINIKHVLRVKSNMDSGMFYGIQKGATVALQSGPSWFQELDRCYQARKELLYLLADKLGCDYDQKSAGMFLWAKLPGDRVSSEEFIDNLLYKKNIFVAPGTVFGEQGKGYIRFSLCVSEEKIREAINRIQN